MIIKPGQTLSGIARQYKTTVDKLLELNPSITNKDKIIAGREIKLPNDAFSTAAARPNQFAAQTGANPANGYKHVEFLRSQLGNASPELRADLLKELGLIGKAATGQLALPEQTKAVVEQVTKGLGPEERDIVIAKAFELSSEGFSVEKTSGPRFAANLTMELSEYVATGAKGSPQLLDKMTQLYKDGQSVFTAKPELERKLAGNLMAGAQNMAARYGDAAPANGAVKDPAAVMANMPPVVRDMYNQLLKDDPQSAKQFLDQVAKDSRIAQAGQGVSEASLIAEMAPGERAMFNEVLKNDPKAARQYLANKFLSSVDVRTGPQLSPQTQAALVAGMSPFLRDMYNMKLKDDPIGATRLLQQLSQNPSKLQGGQGVSEQSLIASMSPTERDGYERLLKDDPYAARDFLLQKYMSQVGGQPGGTGPQANVPAQPQVRLPPGTDTIILTYQQGLEPQEAQLLRTMAGDLSKAGKTLESVGGAAYPAVLAEKMAQHIASGAPVSQAFADRFLRLTRDGNRPDLEQALAGRINIKAPQQDPNAQPGTTVQPGTVHPGQIRLSPLTDSLITGITQGFAPQEASEVRRIASELARQGHSAETIGAKAFDGVIAEAMSQWIRSGQPVSETFTNRFLRLARDAGRPDLERLVRQE